MKGNLRVVCNICKKECALSDAWDYKVKDKVFFVCYECEEKIVSDYLKRNIYK